jgi:hypothetical protein
MKGTLKTSRLGPPMIAVLNEWLSLVARERWSGRVLIKMEGGSGQQTPNGVAT